MTTHEILVKARALIEREEDWCQWTQGRTTAGRGVPAMDPEAVSFCAVGALIRVSDDQGWWPLVRLLDDLVDETFFAIFNNTHSHAEVLAHFDKAIAATAPMPEDPGPEDLFLTEPVREMVPA